MATLRAKEKKKRGLSNDDLSNDDSSNDDSNRNSALVDLTSVYVSFINVLQV